MKNVQFRLKRRNLYKIALIAAAVLLAASCRSIPQKADMDSSIQLLPAGTDVVIRADIEKNRELIEPVLAGFSNLPESLSGEFLERTETVWAGLDFGSSAAGQFEASLIAEGDYPKALIETGLWWDRAWKKQKYNPLPESYTSFPYWYETEGSSQLAFPNSDTLFASGGNIEEMIDSWAVPESIPVSPFWLESEKAADVTIMTRNLTPEDYAAFIPQFNRIPLQGLVLSLNRVGEEYLISGRFEMDNEVAAFLFSTLFRTMIIAAKDEKGNRTFKDPKDIVIKKDGSAVTLSGMKLSVEAVAATEAAWLGTAGLGGSQ